MKRKYRWYLVRVPVSCHIEPEGRGIWFCAGVVGIVVGLIIAVGSISRGDWAPFLVGVLIIDIGIGFCVDALEGV